MLNCFQEEPGGIGPEGSSLMYPKSSGKGGRSKINFGQMKELPLLEGRGKKAGKREGSWGAEVGRAGFRELSLALPLKGTGDSVPRGQYKSYPSPGTPRLIPARPAVDFFAAGSGSPEVRGHCQETLPGRQD